MMLLMAPRGALTPADPIDSDPADAAVSTRPLPPLVVLSFNVSFLPLTPSTLADAVRPHAYSMLTTGAPRLMRVLNRIWLTC